MEGWIAFKTKPPASAMSVGVTRQAPQGMQVVAERADDKTAMAPDEVLGKVFLCLTRVHDVFGSATGSANGGTA